MSFEADLITKLKATSGVTSIIGSGTSMRCYPLALPQQPTYPAVVYRIGITGDRNLSGPSGRKNIDLSLECMDTESADARSLADALRTALDGATGAYGSTDVDMAVYISEDADYLPEVALFRITQQYRFSYKT